MIVFLSRRNGSCWYIIGWPQLPTATKKSPTIKECARCFPLQKTLQNIQHEAICLKLGPSPIVDFKYYLLIQSISALYSWTFTESFISGNIVSLCSLIFCNYIYIMVSINYTYNHRPSLNIEITIYFFCLKIRLFLWTSIAVTPKSSNESYDINWRKPVHSHYEHTFAFSQQKMIYDGSMHQWFMGSTSIRNVSK